MGLGSEGGCGGGWLRGRVDHPQTTTPPAAALAALVLLEWLSRPAQKGTSENSLGESVKQSRHRPR